MTSQEFAINDSVIPQEDGNMKDMSYLIKCSLELTKCVEASPLPSPPYLIVFFYINPSYRVYYIISINLLFYIIYRSYKNIYLYLLSSPNYLIRLLVSSYTYYLVLPST